MTDIQKENKSGGKVPNLRFPNFEGEWKVKKLGEVCEIKTGNKDTQNKVENGKYPFFVRSNTVEKIDSYSYDGEAILTSGDGVGVGKNFHYINGKFDFHQRVYALRNFRNGYSGKYIYHLFSEKFYDRVRKLSAKNSVDSVRMDMISEMKVYFPLLLEQQKISSFLSLIDERIQTQNKIINDLKTLKTATAKKIFSGELRFKDDKGNEFQEWENILLGDTLDYEQPTNYLVSSTEYDDSFETPVVTAGKTFILGYTDEKNGVFEKEKLPVIIFDDFTTASQFVDFSFKAKSSAMKILKAKNGTNIRFIFEALQMINYEVGGHGRHWISVFSNLSISVPSLPEQTKIANFLSAIDSKIDMENQLLQKLEEQKKYLLQNMFV